MCRRCEIQTNRNANCADGLAVQFIVIVIWCQFFTSHPSAIWTTMLFSSIQHGNTHNYTMFWPVHTRTSYTTAICNVKYFVLFSHCYLTTAQQRQQQHEICSRSAGYRSGVTMVNIEIQLNWNISMFCNATRTHYTQTHVDRFFLVKLSVACSVSQLQCYPAFDLHFTDIHWILYW